MERNISYHLMCYICVIKHQVLKQIQSSPYINSENSLSIKEYTFKVQHIDAYIRLSKEPFINKSKYDFFHIKNNVKGIELNSLLLILNY